MLRRLSLTLVLSAGFFASAHLGAAATAVGDGNAVFGSAQAADFTGKIKRVLIKKRRVGSGFKVAAVSAGDDAGSVASAEVVLNDALTGEQLDAFTLGDAKRAAAVLTADLSDDPVVGQAESTLELFINLELTTDGGGDDGDTEARQVGVTLDRTATGAFVGEGLGDDGWKVRVRVGADGAVTARLKNEDRTWQGDGIVVAAVETAAGATAMTQTEVRQRRTAVTDVDLDAIGLVQVETTLFDSAGEVLDTRGETTNVLANSAVPSLSKVSARETNAGDAKLVTWTNSQGEDASLEVEVTDSATGEVVLSTTDDTPIKTQRSYYSPGLEFDPGEEPADYIYLVLIDLLNDAGDPVGEQHEVELVIPAAIEGEVASHYFLFADGTGAVSALVDDEGYHLHLALAGDNNGTITGAAIIFEEPFEGPAPLDTEVVVDFVAQFDKWIQKGDGNLPDSYSVDATLTTPDGVFLGGISASGTGPGVVAKTSGNGSGTKKAANTVRMIQVALL